jgi:hypothetical protein
MKTALMVISILFCTWFVYGQEKTPTVIIKDEKKPVNEVNKEEIKTPVDMASTSGLVKRLYVSLAAGTVIYGDKLGYNGMLEARAYMMDLPYNISIFTGAGGLYQYTKSDLHTMNHIYGYALGGCDYTGLKNSLPVLDALTLRLQLAVGGGYTSDKNSIGNTVGKGGYIVYPSIGADYSFGKVHASLMFGYEIIGVGSTTMSASTISIGAAFTIF